MKKSVAVCLLLGLLVATLVTPADAAKREARREAVETYAVPWLSSPSTGAGCFGDDCVRFPISGSERWVTIEVSDESGTPTAFTIAQKAGRIGAGETVGGPFCGSSGADPVKLVPGVEVFVYVYAAGDLACPGSFGTTGTVRAVFSKFP